jgi:putative chitinase
MVILTVEQLSAICPNLPPGRAPKILAALVPAFSEFQIQTPLRVAAFIAQIAHESGEFKYMRELWGPTPQQLRYEPPSELAARLGNTEKGDGFRYRGRGAIQLTGRTNYRHAGEALGLDLVADPDRASSFEVGIRIAGWYWTARSLNQLADRERFREITVIINGGYNGYVSRLNYYTRAIKQLGAVKENV